MNDSTHTQSPNGLPLDTVHSVLKNRRRRFVVDVLAGRESPIDLAVLARAIAQRLPGDENQNADLDRINTVLHHVDLPKLQEAEVVEYDPAARVVRPLQAERFARFLDSSESLG